MFPRGLSVSAISSGSSHNPHPRAVLPVFNLLAVEALVGAWSPGNGVCFSVFDALTVLRCEVVLLQVLNPFSCLSLQVSKVQQPGQGGVVGA